MGNGSRIRVLFVAEGVTLAHVVRPSVLADGLSRADFEIHFACSREYHSLVTRPGMQLHGISSTPPAEFLEILERGDELFPERTLVQYAEEELRLLNAVRPDIVVGDFRFSLAATSVAKNIPYVNLTNAYWSPAAVRPRFPLPSFRPIRRTGLQHIRNRIGKRMIETVFNLVLPAVFRKQARGLDRTRARYGLPPFPDYLTGFIWGDRTCFADTPSSAPVHRLDASQRYIGPICWSPSVALPNWWNSIDRSRPLVFVSLGSSGPVECLPMIAEVLSQLPVEVVVATAGRVRREIFPESFRVADYLPGELVVRDAALAITNGGSPSSYQALREETPIIGLPLNMDQLLCMSNLERLGVGIMLRADNVRTDDFRSAVTAILGNDRYLQKVRPFAADLRSYRAEEKFAEVLFELVPGARLAPTERRYDTSWGGLAHG